MSSDPPVIPATYRFATASWRRYPDVYTPEALAALRGPGAARRRPRRQLMAARIARRARAGPRPAAHRASSTRPAVIAGTDITVQDARDGNFVGSEIPADLRAPVDPGHRARRAKPDAPVEQSIRNVAYALLSGADGWMFDGEDALGQVVDDVARQPAQPEAGHRTAIPLFLTVAEQVAGEMNAWAQRLLRPRDHRRLARAARLHDARSSAPAACTSTTATSGTPTARGFSASIVDAALYVVNNHARAARGRRLARALPAEDPDGRGGRALERHPVGARSAPRRCRTAPIKVYVLVEQLEACFQLMEIRAALGAPLRRLQHRPLGLHQQRRPTRWPGIRPSSTRTSTPSR